MTRIALVSLVNDDAQFDACQASLRRIADPFPEWWKVEPNKHGWNAAQGLNHGIESVDADWVVCLHQDVLFPDDFWQRLQRALADLDDDVALAGLVGCERKGYFRGHIYDPNGHCYWPSLPKRVLTLDEVLIAVRKSAGLRFNEEVPGFHCYGADICFQADARGLRTVAVDAPLVHLSTGKLDEHYERASQWLMETWGERYGYVLPDARAAAARRAEGRHVPQAAASLATPRRPPVAQHQPVPRRRLQGPRAGDAVLGPGAAR